MTLFIAAGQQAQGATARRNPTTISQAATIINEIGATYTPKRFISVNLTLQLPYRNRRHGG
jgi:hypothetical protein